MQKVKNVFLSIIIVGVSSLAIYSAGNALAAFKKLNDAIDTVNDRKMSDDLSSINKLRIARKELI